MNATKTKPKIVDLERNITALEEESKEYGTHHQNGHFKPYKGL